MAEPNTDANKVIDLRTRTSYAIDCAALARNRVVLARRGLDLTHADFAAMLTGMVGWPVTAEAVEQWETTLVPPGDVLIAASTVTSAASDRLGARSHKFIAAFIGPTAVQQLAAQGAARRGDHCGDHHVLPVDHPDGTCELHLWPTGVVIFHLVEELDVLNIAHLAVWRYRSYDDNLTWATGRLRDLTGDDTATASYVLSLYWVHRPIWVGRMLETALRIICAPRVLIERETTGRGTDLAAAEQAERQLLAEGFDHPEMRECSLKGVSLGYTSWSGVVYHPLDPSRALTETELVDFELRLQSIWAYCEHINDRAEQGEPPDVAPAYGWRYLRGRWSQLTNPRPQETGQHRSMRDAVVYTSGITGHLQQAIEVLREAGTR